MANNRPKKVMCVISAILVDIDSIQGQNRKFYIQIDLSCHEDSNEIVFFLFPAITGSTSGRGRKKRISWRPYNMPIIRKQILC